MYAPLFALRSGILLTSRFESTTDVGARGWSCSTGSLRFTDYYQTSKFRSNINFTSVEETGETYYYLYINTDE
jgi:hypothetical protein